MAAKNLVIVESPAKAKTIEKYLGADFGVLSSVGHIRSIPKKAKNGVKPVDIENGFKTIYEIDPEKKKIIADLKKALINSENVWLATDEDREGEAIAWHLCEVLKLDPASTKRIVFHEITKNAIDEAVKNPRTIDMSLVEAQQARQILDRIVGFELSPVVWRKVPGGKSAGRVQSPAVRLLVEREREIKVFKGSADFKVTAEFKAKDGTLRTELPKRFATESEAQKFLEGLIEASFTVSDTVTSPGTRNPSAPFITSTLQQEANARLGFSAKATMAAAQKLYQEGKITYMRTDSVNLSGQALSQITNYITKTYGEKYHQVRNFKTKSASAQEAHEAIRPTDIAAEQVSSDSYNQKLYDLIRRRTLASQMASAKLEKTVVTITISDHSEVFEAKGEVIVFDGFLKVYGVNKKEDDILPPLSAKESLQLTSALARQTFARPPARYSEGSLVKKLEELGIGRPSTYATIINTVQVRGYAVKGSGEGEPRDVVVLTLKDKKVERQVVQENTGSDKGKLVPTSVGQVISDFLLGNFDKIVDYDFTAEVEKEFDLVATGKLPRNKMLMSFYEPFHRLIEKSDDIKRSEVAHVRELGKDPKTGKPILARYGRYGPIVQLGESPPNSSEGRDKKEENSEEKPIFAPLPKNTTLDSVTLEQALEMFKLPRVVGKTVDGREITANFGRFGPYVQVDKLYAPIKPLDPLKVTETEAREAITKKEEQEKNKYIAKFDSGINIVNGPYGPYITDGKKNARIPKDQDPAKLTEEQAKKLLDEAPAKKTFRRRKK
ncbi:MAG TPA: type I DNA topoisomerase [Candidatus Saccharimonadales bacterium]|nr:type I DNA topoisomerase [Candidatus Saccharimonadales bacterium]